MSLNVLNYKLILLMIVGLTKFYIHKKSNMNFLIKHIVLLPVSTIDIILIFFL